MAALSSLNQGHESDRHAFEPEVVITDSKTGSSGNNELPFLSSFQQKTVISKPSASSSGQRSTPVPASPSELGPHLVGQKLAHLELEEFVGGGGMGAVFRAVDTQLGRTVAVKVLARDETDEDTLRRFRNEAQSAARLDHPHIARVFNVGEHEGWNYIVFEFIEGANLRDLVEKHGGRLPLEDAISYTLQVAQAVDHAFQRDVVHRDIKPSNVLVTPSGAAKVVDMGLARLHQVETPDNDLTATGVTLGTFDYISPEQARDPRAADVRSDLYSLGCTLYFMLAGRPPFPEGTVLQKLLSHTSDDPPDIRRFRPDVPEEVSDVLDKMLAKQPRDRYQQPSELIGELIVLADDWGGDLGPHFGLGQEAGEVWVAQEEPTTLSTLERMLPIAIPFLLLIGLVLLSDLLWPRRMTVSDFPPPNIQPPPAISENSQPPRSAARRPFRQPADKSSAPASEEPLETRQSAKSASRRPSQNAPWSSGPPTATDAEAGGSHLPGRVDQNNSLDSNLIDDNPPPAKNSPPYNPRVSNPPANGASGDQPAPSNSARSQDPFRPNVDSAPLEKPNSDGPPQLATDPSDALKPSNSGAVLNRVDTPFDMPSREKGDRPDPMGRQRPHSSEKSTPHERPQEEIPKKARPKDRPKQISPGPQLPMGVEDADSRQPMESGDRDHRQPPSSDQRRSIADSKTPPIMAPAQNRDGPTKIGGVAAGGPGGQALAKTPPTTVVVGQQGDPSLRAPVVSSLGEAVRLAARTPSIHTIELRFNGYQREAPFTVASQQLTIQAGSGFSPILGFQPAPPEYSDQGYLIRIVGGELTFEGVHFDVQLPSDAYDRWTLFQLHEVVGLNLRDSVMTIANVDSRGRSLQDRVSFIEIQPSRGAQRTIMALPKMGPEESKNPNNYSGEPEKSEWSPTAISLSRCIARGRADFLYARRVEPFSLNWDQGLLITNRRLLQTGGAVERQKWTAPVKLELTQLTAMAQKGLCLMRTRQDAPYQAPLQIDSRFCILMARADSPFIEHRGPQSAEEGLAAGGPEGQASLMVSGMDNFYPTGNKDHAYWRVDQLDGDPQDVILALRDEKWCSEENARRTVFWSPADREQRLHQRYLDDFSLDARSDNPARRCRGYGGQAGFHSDLMPQEPKLKNSN